jgi:3-deoxy-manno-octulosonate cytidylyltransferase (CMP-KDO synthetase)
MKNTAEIRIAGIIPARYASTRFPGKPLVMIGGKPMIRRVYEQSCLSLPTVYVATDDQRIYDAVAGFGGKVVMTSSDHRSGTDRCAEAAEKIAGLEGFSPDVIVNIQGDEPYIRPEQIDLLASCFDDRSVEIATLVRRAEPGEDLANPNQPKVVLDLSGNAIYFSRSVIPFLRDAPAAEWSARHNYYKHIGLYAYRTAVLKQLALLPGSPLEKAESLEQNRWLENGFRIRTAVTLWESLGIDTPEDLERVEKIFDQKNKNAYL